MTFQTGKLKTLVSINSRCQLLTICQKKPGKDADAT